MKSLDEQLEDPMKLRLALVLGAALAAGCEEPPAPTAGTAPPAAPAKSAAPARPAAPQGLGSITEAGNTFRPSHVVIVWEEAKQELRFHLYTFAPSAAELLQVQGGMSFISFGKPSPNSKLWPDHCPSATYVLSWARKPKEAVGDLAQARYLLHLHGISKRNANMSINRLSVEGDLRGKIAPGERISLKVKDQGGSDESPIAWNLVLAGEVLAPPPPPQAPKLSADQKGSLGVVTCGDIVFKVEGAMAKRKSGENLARVALLSSAPTPEDLTAYRTGKFAPMGKLGHVELILFCGKEGFGSPPKTSQQKIVIKYLTGSLASSSFSMSKGMERLSLGGGLKPGERLTLRAKGVLASEYGSSLGEVTSWDLDFKDVEVLSIDE